MCKFRGPQGVFEFERDLACFKGFPLKFTKFSESLQCRKLGNIAFQIHPKFELELNSPKDSSSNLKFTFKANQIFMKIRFFLTI